MAALNWIPKTITAIGTGLFGNSKAGQNGATFAQEAAKGIGTWIDERNFTTEEAKKANLATLEMVVDVVKSSAKHNCQQSHARRQIAWLVIRTYVGFLFMAAVLYPIDTHYADFVLKLCNDTYLGEITGGIGLFYFLTHTVRASKGN